MTKYQQALALLAEAMHGIQFNDSTAKAKATEAMGMLQEDAADEADMTTADAVADMTHTEGAHHAQSNQSDNS